jgi:TRAP-type mannitol/chloroaromatic compound transport system substrate-binding protein
MRCIFGLSVIAACVAALALVSGCGDSGDQQQAVSSGDAPAAPSAQKVTLQMTSVFPSSLVLLGDSALEFADKVERVSGGTLEMKVYEPGALVPGLEAIPAVSKGSVEAAWSSPGFFAGKGDPVRDHSAGSVGLVPKGNQLG